MKAFILAVLTLACAAPVWAAGNTPALTVKITSFTQIGGTASPMGELCGHVDVANNPSLSANSLIPVTVTSDPGTSNPGSYTVLADQNGNFCVLIATYAGTASAQAWIPGPLRAPSTTAYLDHLKRD